MNPVTPNGRTCSEENSLHRWRAVLFLTANKEISVLGTLAIVLVVLWLLGIVTSYTVGGLIHILLVIAIVAVLVRIIQGRNPLGT
jgi:hypothetical protein